MISRFVFENESISANQKWGVPRVLLGRDRCSRVCYYFSLFLALLAFVIIATACTPFGICLSVFHCFYVHILATLVAALSFLQAFTLDLAYIKLTARNVKFCTVMLILGHGMSLKIVYLLWECAKQEDWIRWPFLLSGYVSLWAAVSLGLLVLFLIDLCSWREYCYQVCRTANCSEAGCCLDDYHNAETCPKIDGQPELSFLVWQDRAIWKMRRAMKTYKATLERN